jgi:hypothetical protein
VALSPPNSHSSLAPPASIVGTAGMGAGDFATLFAVRNSGGETVFLVDSSGDVQAVLADDAALFLVDDNGGTTCLSVDGTGAVGVAKVGGSLGFYGGAKVAKPTGVAVTAAAIHAALVDLGLIAA